MMWFQFKDDPCANPLFKGFKAKPFHATIWFQFLYSYFFKVIRAKGKS